MGLGHSPLIVSTNLEVAYDIGNIKSYSLSGTSLLNLTSSSYTGTLTSGPIPRLGNGGFVNFDGTDDYIVLTRPVQDDISLCCWFKTTQSAGTADQWYNGRGLIDCEVGGAVNDFGLALGAGKVMFGTGNPDVTVVSSSTYNDNNWHFAVGTRTKSSGVLTLYVDGTQVGTTTSTNTGSLTSPTNMRIGSRQTGSVFFQGDIALPLIYSKALTAAEVLQNYSATRNRFNNFYLAPIDTTSLVLNLDAGNPSSYSGSGTTWTSLTGTNNATLQNGPTFDTANGGTIAFDGTNDYASCTSSSDFAFGTGDFTLEMWIKHLPTGSTYSHLFSLPDQGTFTLKAWDNGTRAGIYFYSSAFRTDVSGIPNTNADEWVLERNVWAQVVFVRSNSVAYGYKNAVLKGSKTSYTSNYSSQALNIGWGYSSEYQAKNIAVARIWKRALSQAEITSSFNALRGRFGL